jgi:GNAT superfamily N-acetyltransferase
MTDYRFDFASLADVPRLGILIERAYRGPEAMKGWTNEASLLTGPRSSPAEIEGSSRRRIRASSPPSPATKLVGCALLQKHGEGAYFGMFAIDPDMQGGGLGKALLGRCEDAARELWDAKFCGSP